MADSPAISRNPAKRSRDNSIDKKLSGNGLRIANVLNYALTWPLPSAMYYVFWQKYPLARERFSGNLIEAKLRYESIAR